MTVSDLMCCTVPNQHVLKLFTRWLCLMLSSSGHKSWQCLWLTIIISLLHTNIQPLAILLPIFTTAARRGNALNTWSGIREQNTLGLWSQMDCIQRQTRGFLKVGCGWETYGLVWCYVTLNPHHLLEAQVCRACQPPTESNTPGALSFMGF